MIKNPNLFITLLSIFLTACSNHKQQNEFDMEGYHPNVMHYDLKYHALDAKTAFYSNNQGKLNETEDWFQYFLNEMRKSKNTETYFKVCSGGSNMLGELLTLYTEEMNRAYIENRNKPVVKVSNEILKLETELDKAIQDCHEFVTHPTSQETIKTS